MKMEPVRAFEAAQPIVVDLDKPTLRGLSYALRNLGALMPGFRWGYRSCETCAMAVARRLWPEVEALWRIYLKKGSYAETMSLAFDIEIEAVRDIFCNGRAFGLHSWNTWLRISPVMVADAIDGYLARQ